MIVILAIALFVASLLLPGADGQEIFGVLPGWATGYLLLITPPVGTLMALGMYVAPPLSIVMARIGHKVALGVAIFSLAIWVYDLYSVGFTIRDQIAWGILCGAASAAVLAAHWARGARTKC
jgi:hypothetical protein